MISAPFSTRAHLLQDPNRRKARKRKVKLPPSSYPHDCVTLGVDGGARAGWSIWHKHRLVDFGEVDGLNIDAVCKVVNAALLIAELAHTRCVLVVEKPPTHHKNRTFESMLGTGETRGSWRLAWRRAKQPDRLRAGVDVRTWRSSMLGKGFGNASREQVRKHEQRLARVLVMKHYVGAEKPIGPDCAPAICIGRWGTHAGDVGARLLPRPKKAKAA